VDVSNYVNKEVPIYKLYSLGDKTTAIKTTRSNTRIKETTYQIETKTYYMEKCVQDGYKKDLCPICSGAGYFTKTKQEGAFCKIIF